MGALETSAQEWEQLSKYCSAKGGGGGGVGSGGDLFTRVG